jgi:hypothetical protein
MNTAATGPSSSSDMDKIRLPPLDAKHWLAFKSVYPLALGKAGLSPTIYRTQVLELADEDISDNEGPGNTRRVLKRRNCRKERENIHERVDKAAADVLYHIDQAGLNIKEDDQQPSQYEVVAAILPDPLPDGATPAQQEQFAIARAADQAEADAATELNRKEAVQNVRLLRAARIWEKVCLHFEQDAMKLKINTIRKFLTEEMSWIPTWLDSILNLKSSTKN